MAAASVIPLIARVILLIQLMRLSSFSWLLTKLSKAVHSNKDTKLDARAYLTG